MTWLLVQIFISPAQRAPMQEVQTVKAIKNAGLQGDRYAKQMGTFSKMRRVAKNVRRRIVHRGLRSLLQRTRQAVANRQIVEQHHVSIMTMDGLRRGNTGHDARFTPEDTRRNLIVDGMTAEELLQLVGKRFRLGDVEMLGVEDCAPCEEPSLLSGKVNFKARFSGLGGLRAKVLVGGWLRVGDQLTVLQEPLYRWTGSVTISRVSENDSARWIHIEHESLDLRFPSANPGFRSGSTFHASIEVNEG